MNANKVEITSVRQVTNDGNHNAFTDMCRYRNRYFLTFRRCPDGHRIASTSAVVVLSSSDAKEWTPVHSFSVPGRDVRDPHFLEFNHILFVYTGTWRVQDDPVATRDLNEHQGYCSWSGDGMNWEGPRYLVGTQSHYIWRAVVWGENAYLCGRRNRGFVPPSRAADSRIDVESALLRSPDGFHWEAVGLFQETYGNETAFLFEEDGSILAVARCQNNCDLAAQVCRSQPPYRQWQRKRLDSNIGGPMLARWGDRYIVGGRDNRDPDRPVTALYWLMNDNLVEAAVLPSGGDNSYPGFVELDSETALLSYYSSHEGTGASLSPSAIYLAELKTGF